MIISISLLAPSPRITKERAEAWEARESRDCTCVKATACLRSRRGLLTTERGDPHTIIGERRFGFVLFLHFFFVCLEWRELEGDIFHIRNGIALFQRTRTHTTTLR